MKEELQIEGITNSYELFKLLNEHRVNVGKKPMNKHSQLVIKIKDECGGLHGNKKITMQESTANNGFVEFDAYELNRKEVYLVSMRESKEVRSSVYDYITSLEEQNALMKDIVWETINGAAFLSQELALKSAGIKHPRLFMKYLKSDEKFYNKTVYENEYLQERQVSADKSNRYWKFSKAGFEWLLRSKEKANAWVDSCHKSSKLATGL